MQKGKADQQGPIADQIKQKINLNGEKYKRVVGAFVTFETCEANKRLLKNCETVRNFFNKVKFERTPRPLMILGEKTEVIKAEEPSNINWENLSSIGTNKFMDWFLKSLFLSIVLFLALGFLAWFKNYV